MNQLNRKANKLLAPVVLALGLSGLGAKCSPQTVRAIALTVEEVACILLQEKAPDSNAARGVCGIGDDRADDADRVFKANKMAKKIRSNGHPSASTSTSSIAPVAGDAGKD